MGSAYIESAYYGDEKSMKNITRLLGDKVLGTTLDVPVNEQLIPPFEVAPKTELSNEDVRKIRDQASKSCGGVDKECINATEARLRQEALTEKEKIANSSAGVIKGRRLTVNIVDDKGKRRRIVVPDGQQFKLDNVTVNDPKKGPMQLPPMKYFQNQLYLIAGIVVATFIYVFGVVATYTVFSPMGLFVVAPLTVISIFVPYSGYVMIFLYFMVMSGVKAYVGE